ncbi:DUF998 domain-containing protein [Pseudonocardia sp. GCM10023141]|uniref:DUF998 domain-containing protein n=1 Tax=Pseudonocardia sp. GCM10023141 TaxID=3252653 RepID=UPI003619EBDE
MTPTAPSRALLTCGIVAGPLFVAAFLVEGALRPGYSPMRHPVSSLSIGEYGWTQMANFLVTGLLVLALAWGLRDEGRWTPTLVGLLGVGLLGACVFTCDPINGYPPGTPLAPVATTHGTLHSAFSSLLFLGLPIACLVAARRAGRGRFAGYSIATAIAFLALFVLAALGFAQNPAFLPVAGLMQRLCLAVGFAWLAALALRRRA